MLDLRNCDNMELMAEFEDNHFDLAIVDPPYGIGTSQEYGNTRGKPKSYIKKQWDNEVPKPKYFKELFRVSKNQIIWGANHFVEFLPISRGWVYWEKRNGGNYSDGELAFTSFDRVLKQVYRATDSGNRFHPTQKPKELYKWILHNYSKEGDKILDTHLGSGSIAIACHEMGFDLVGCELDTDYYNAMMERIEIETRQQDLFA